MSFEVWTFVCVDNNGFHLRFRRLKDERLQSWRKVWEDVIRRDLREMHEAGMDLLVGTDVAALNIFPGFSIHDEMALFVAELAMTDARRSD